MRSRPLRFEQLSLLTILKKFDLKPLCSGLLLRLQPCGGKFGPTSGLAGADRRGVLVQLSQQIGTFDMVRRFVSRDWSGQYGQERIGNWGDVHIFL